jgi:hypothetical protein
VVLTAAEPVPAGPADPTGVSQRLVGRRGLLGAVVGGVALGFLGWVLPTPGGPLVAPTAVVAAVGGGLATVAWIVACFRPDRRDLWTFAVAVAAFTVLAAVWTFEFSLPVAMAWDSGATPSAERALVQVRDGPHNARGVPLLPCTNVRTGSVGPLDAPYAECAVSSPLGHFVTYTAIGPGPVHGLGYTDIGAATFQDECSRHLTGPWWMFVQDTSGIGNCPFGYRFHGGG